MENQEENLASTIVTVSELIDNAFGDPEVNVVHHKQVQTILYLLARQLRILERQVSVKLTPSQAAQKSSSTLSVTEVKLQTPKHSGKSSEDDGRGRKKGSKSSKDKKDEALPGATTSLRATTDLASTKKESSTGKESNGIASLTTDKPSSTDKTSSALKSSAAASAIGENSTSEEPSTTERQQVDKKTADKKISSEKKPGRAKSSDKQAPGKVMLQDYQELLEEVELSRERELRVIRQRGNSREQPEKSPTPIASMDSVEATFEKLLVVERLPAEVAAAKAAREKSGKSRPGPRVSVVTLEQFQELAGIVKEIQKKLDPIGALDFPENAALMQELRKGASLTEAMAALQISARLEATEKTLKNLLSLVTDMAQRMPGFEPIDTATADNIDVLFGAQRKDQVKALKKQKKGEKTAREKSEGYKFTRMSVPSVESGTTMLQPTEATLDGGSLHEDALVDAVTFADLERSLKELYDDIIKQVTNITQRTTTSAETALKLVIKLEAKIETSLNLGSRMNELEDLVANYTDQINALDTGLSSQLTNYQEELTQMQHDLETGIETMAEVLANSGGDATAVAELNAHFNELQLDIDDKVLKQNELRDIQYKLSLEIDGLRSEIEMLRDTKSDREEVIDALRDKVGLGDLNGLISLQQFEAVTGDIEKRLASAYDKFNNQETVWQRVIDDLRREFGEKADLVQVDNLRCDINYYLEVLRQRINKIVEIVGNPVACTLARRLSRDAACLSCAAPAIMKVEQSTLPILPAARPATVGAEAPKSKGEGDHVPCYPGFPVKHPIDPRAHICNRWCGGSHTVIDTKISRVPPGVILTPLSPKYRGITQSRGIDGKMYAVDTVRQPCAQCNTLRGLTAEPSPTPENNLDLEPRESHFFTNVTNIIHPDPLPESRGDAAEDDLASMIALSTFVP